MSCAKSRSDFLFMLSFLRIFRSLFLHRGQKCRISSFALAILPGKCYTKNSFILLKAMMRTNRCLFPAFQREPPPFRRAVSGSAYKRGLPPQSAEENLCRVRPLQHSEWRASARNSGGTVERFGTFRRFIPLTLRDGASFFVYTYQKGGCIHEDHLQGRHRCRVRSE